MADADTAAASATSAKTSISRSRRLIHRMLSRIRFLTAAQPRTRPGRSVTVSSTSSFTDVTAVLSLR
ncbi:hypothetical protein GCM10020221_08790 [Streptomyces thioluteus]|uniref:Uncharacterized protein n=1 Tax=Streptomyces thioluteus TaxID=66431 RepID=A0ABN3WHB1_STRTU